MSLRTIALACTFTLQLSAPAEAASAKGVPGERLLGQVLPTGWRPSTIEASSRMLGAARHEAKAGTVVLIISRLSAEAAAALDPNAPAALRAPLEAQDPSLSLDEVRVEDDAIVVSTRRRPDDGLSRTSYVFSRNSEAWVFTLMGPAKRVREELDRLLVGFIPDLLRSTETDEGAKEVQTRGLPRK